MLHKSYSIRLPYLTIYGIVPHDKPCRQPIKTGAALAKRKESQPRPSTSIGVLSLLLAALVLAVIGYFLEDSIGVPFTIFGSIIWIVALGLAFMFGLLYFSQFVLPVGGGEGWSQGLILLWQYYQQQAKSYLKNLFKTKPEQSRRRVVTDKPVSDPDALSETFKTLKAGMVHSHQALAIDQKNSFQRAAGPGFVMLYKGEKVREVIDLRPHVRIQPVKATTRDGIPIETNVFVTFRVRQNLPELADSGIQYPYDRDAIFRVSYANSIDMQEQVRVWTEQVCSRAAGMLVMELAKYSLDELYRVDDDHIVPLEDIQQRVTSQLARDFELQGIEVIFMGTTDLTLPEDIVTQRIKNWQARWEREIQVRRAEGNAEVMRRVKKARARVQIEIIESIIQNIEAMRRTGTADLPDIIMLRMIEVLEEAMSDTSVQALVPEHLIAGLVMDTSRQLRLWSGTLPTPGEGEAG